MRWHPPMGRHRLARLEGRAKLRSCLSHRPGCSGPATVTEQDGRGSRGPSAKADDLPPFRDACMSSQPLQRRGPFQSPGIAHAKASWHLSVVFAHGTLATTGRGSLRCPLRAEFCFWAAPRARCSGDVHRLHRPRRHHRRSPARRNDQMTGDDRWLGAEAWFLGSGQVKQRVG